MSVPSTMISTTTAQMIEITSIAISNDLTWVCFGGNSICFPFMPAPILGLLPPPPVRIARPGVPARR